eukprot:CAMPEP_0172900612 /NCGR_PEP_ID=MMETSP1075-20121228/164460_1 /TAXON_ID=2916 /ORGANISM="Ceratium fusus, Strain PA161109" /LENGTH=106 /DNA_ID=CAMNT_0013756831 /DNA_START=341 /DNA_END=658 /DNA_ORIENTATION=+
MRIGAMAQCGIAEANGERKNAVNKQYKPKTIAIRPVRPPSAIPAEADILIKTGEHPRNAEIMVPSPQQAYTAVPPGTSPLLCNNFAISADPISEPLIDKRTSKESE